MIETTVRDGNKLLVNVGTVALAYTLSGVTILILCLVGEPMDSVCEEAGPREPSKVCHSEVKCAAITDIQKEIAECPTITEVQKEVADAAPTSSETPRKDAGSLPDGRTTAAAPKPGKSSNLLVLVTSNVVTVAH